LFGDFSIDEILDNDTGYLNSVLFLMYMFVVVFIMLSMFFAILGENQSNLRDEQHEARKAGDTEIVGDGYGIFYSVWSWFRHGLMRVPLAGESLADLLDKAAEAAQESEPMEATPLDRVEARQLELFDKVDELEKLVRMQAEALKAVTGVGGHSGATVDRCAPLLTLGDAVPPTTDPEVLKVLEEIKHSMSTFAAPARSKRRVEKKRADPRQQPGEATEALVARGNKIVAERTGRGPPAEAQRSASRAHAHSNRNGHSCSRLEA